MKPSRAVLALGILFSALSSTTAQPTRASLILITVDTIRADHVGFLQPAPATTPTLAALARRGVVFEQATTPVPLTLPAHTSLMTATYPNYHGVRDNSLGGVPSELTTLAEILSAEGYRTGAIVGSSVLDHRFGLDQGFGSYSDRFEAGIKRGVDAERRANQVIDEAIQWVAGSQPGPFFLWLHLYDPHSPYQAPGLFGDRGYVGEIEYVDQELGRFFAALEELQLFSSTLITVTGDHGEDLGQHGEPTHGFFLYDTSLRVPLVIKFPSEAHAGTSQSRPVSLVDVAPTLLQVLGLRSSPDFQGKGLLGLILGRPEPVREIYSETLYPNLHFGWNALFSLRDDRFKFIRAPQAEFFDLQADPDEEKNLYGLQRALADQYGARLEQLRSRYDQQALEPALEVDPELKERLRSLGYATLAGGLRKSGDYSGADPKEKIHVYRQIFGGMESFILENYPAAVTQLQQAVALDPSVALAFDYLGSSLMAMDSPQEALAAYQEAQKLAPGRADFAAHLAHVHLQLGNSRAAAAGFELATQLEPENWEHWNLLATSQVQNQKPEPALEAYQTSLGLSPSNPIVLFNLGTLYEQTQNFLLGIEVFRQLVELTPDSAEAWNGLANCSQGSGLGENAEEAFQRALELKPDYPEAHYNYANLLVQRERLEEAVEHYQLSLKSDPSFATAYYNLAVVLEVQGKVEEAAEARRKYEELAGAGKP